jgi:hypothetical protein
MWQAGNGKMFIDNSKPDSDTMGAAARKGFADNLRWGLALFGFRY